MTIKLAPEHVGTRVLLSNDTVHFVTDMTDTHYWLTEAGVPDESLIFILDALDDDDDPFIQCLLDAANPLDVPVPEWCGMITLWQRSGKNQRLRPAGFLRKQDWGKLLTMPEGWSPAPGQMPPRGDA
jgi:hypothetical protein